MDKISVVMATYNGEKHIGRQLETLRDQTKAPDEVLILDDQSTDGTVRMIREFIKENRLKTWTLQQNETRLGWKKNFITGIRQASGDLIFLSDQDDVWYGNKIAEMAEAMSDPRILLLACDYNVIYEPGAIRAKVYQKTEKEAEGLVARYEFKTNFFMNPMPGCSYVLRKAFTEKVTDLWFPAAPHDEFLWLAATIQDGAYFYNRTLMDYIRYAGNSSEIRYKDIEMQEENLEYIGQMLERLKTITEQTAGEHRVTEDKKRKLEKATIWCEKRKTLMRTRNPIRWLLMCPYWGYYNSAQNCLSDLWLVLFGKFERKTR